MSDVTDLKEYKRQQIIKEELSRGRTPLYISHATGKITGSPNAASGPDFANRLDKIRNSIERINRLMAELKQLSEREKSNVP